jgi:hypothetical protein
MPRAAGVGATTSPQLGRQKIRVPTKWRRRISRTLASGTDHDGGKHGLGPHRQGLDTVQPAHPGKMGKAHGG